MNITYVAFMTPGDDGHLKRESIHKLDGEILLSSPMFGDTGIDVIYSLDGKAKRYVGVTLLEIEEDDND
jgi:hypothetical protein